MVSPDTALRRLLRETGKLLRPYGFEGEEPTWSRVESGGVARVGRTRVARTWTDGQQRIAFGLTLDAVPVAWWEYRTWLATRRGLPSTPLEETTGPGLVTAPPSFEAGALWTIGVDPEQPGHARQDDVEAIRDRLRHHVHGHARAALRLLDPEFHVEALLDITDPTPRVW
ncbi:hypothetical protein, partial [Nocardia takedensis]|uniref:hypothetical protein n=1 Tax=Nocardia takedensis TaxID=259390 RepID=UPI0005929EB5